MIDLHSHPLLKLVLKIWSSAQPCFYISFNSLRNGRSIGIITLFLLQFGVNKQE